MAHKRRGRGEGSIFQRADGLYVSSVSLGYDGNGKRRRKTVYGQTKAEVQQKLRQLQDKADRGQIADAPNLTLGAYLQSWLAAIRGSVSDGTHGYYEEHVRLHITPRIGGTKLAALNAAAVQAFYGRMAAEGVSDALRRKVGVTLGVALAEAVRLRLIFANPVRDVRKPKPARKEVTALTAEQAVAFLEAARPDRLFALYVVAIDSGARQGELFGLEWQDVDFEAGCIQVRRTLRSRKGELCIGPPKTEQSRRRIDLSRYALEVLNEHRKAMLAEGHYGPDAPVFCDTDGGRLRKSNVVRRSFHPILKRAGVTGITFHGLRHSCASMLLHHGESIKVVSERLGHASTAMTLNIYAHVAPGAQARAAARLDALLRPPDQDQARKSV
jgi:integrase